MSLPPPGTVLADKYRLEALLGEGGMGAVFRARHVLMDTPVALKWLRPDVIDSRDARERLLREARAVARIRHPNVVHVYDVDTHDGAPFIVMELLEGESFADLIARESLPITRVLEILIEAMKGLSAAHEHGIIHRDIKPENIFIARDRRHPDGVPKLLDFGISMTTDNGLEGRITPTGHSVGTPVFMSVEQLTRMDEVDQRTDVYSFGVVLYRALTGRLPFEGDSFASIVIDIATKDALSPKQIRPNLPSSLDQVVMKAMARNRDQRYPTVDALISALREAEQSFGSTPSSVYAPLLTPKPPPMPAFEGELEGSTEDPFRPRGRRKWTSYAVVASICIAAAVLGWSLLSVDDAPRASQTVDPVNTGSTLTPPPLPTPPAPTAAPSALADPAAAAKLPAQAPRIPSGKAPPALPKAKAAQAPAKHAPSAAKVAAPAPSAAKVAAPARPIASRPAAAPAPRAPSTAETAAPKPPEPAPAATPRRRSGQLGRDDF